ncbi:hypothetical protein D1872_297020 [compost metagenome]
MIQRAPGDSDLFENIVRTGALEAFLPEQLIRRVKNFILSLLGVFYDSHSIHLIYILFVLDRLSVGYILT